MQAVKGYLSKLPPIESTEPYFSESEILARVEGLKRIEAALELARDEDLSDFPKQGRKP